MKQVRQRLRRSRARTLCSCMAIAVTALLAACSSSPPSTSSGDSSIVAFIAHAIKATLWGDNSFFGALAFALASLILGFIAFVDKQTGPVEVGSRVSRYTRPPPLMRALRGNELPRKCRLLL